MKQLARIFCAATALMAAPAMAVTLSIGPATQNQTLGAPVSVNILVSDLGDFSSSSLGNFDLFVSYDSSILTPTQADYGTQLNQGDINDSIQEGLVLVSGPTAECAAAACLEVAEVSFLTAQELVDGQPGSFLLASITFNTVALGSSALDFQFTELGDEFGDEILNANLQSASVTVAAAQQVPLPASLLLFGVALFWRRR